VYGTPLTSWLARIVRGGLGVFGGPAAGRGDVARVGATHRARPPVETASANGNDAAESILLAIPPRAPFRRRQRPSRSRTARSTA
jgi:hypothetical protein